MAARNPYRSLPSVDRLLSDERVRALANGGESGIATIIARQAIESARQAIAGGSEAPTEDQLVESVLGLAAAAFEPSLRPVINATGVIIHTNLGRAPSSDEAIEAMAAVSRGYSNLEFDLEAGERGSRYTHLESALTRLSGAEAAIAVNNNASALLLTLSALAHDREVIISRGQAVEIGGGFRIPDVMAQSGARLAEVGTTNRTYLRDYEAAITEQTATLHHYLRGEAITKVPVWRMIAAPLSEIERRARRWARAIRQGARVLDGRSMIGGGSLPEESLPTKLVAIAGEGGYIAELALRLRTGDPPVVAR